MGALLEIKNLTVRFHTEFGTVHAVNDVSYILQEGESLGIVGESGSGKSVHFLSILGLVPMPPARIEKGEAFFDGRDLLSLSQEELRHIRGKEIGVVFQDPMTSLNPVLTIGRQIAERLIHHLRMKKHKAWSRAAELLDLVGIVEPQRRLKQYPHQLSGGMRQRVMIAMALSCEPKLLIADEPTTALDVTIQDQVLELIQQLKQELGMAMIWITHDLGVVAGIADTIQVMYAGMILERGGVRDVFEDPRNAYTIGLLGSLPYYHRGGSDRLHQIPGHPPDMYQEPVGDPFAPRNPYATERCKRERPPLLPVVDGPADHLVAAWYRVHTDPTLPNKLT
jgi:oligopeptide/dipeptide ABC transporter ATP-binding protein